MEFPNLGRRHKYKPGDKKDKLTIVEVFPFDKEKGGTVLVVDCECGNRKKMTMSCLRGSRTCGCERYTRLKRSEGAPLRNIPWRLAEGEAATRSLYKSYRNRALKKEIEFNLTMEHFKELISSECLFCGAPPSTTFGHVRYNGNIVYNGVDRLDNDFGYDVDNCVTACKECNLSKGRRSVLEFLDHATRITMHQRSVKNLAAFEREESQDIAA